MPSFITRYRHSHSPRSDGATHADRHRQASAYRDSEPDRRRDRHVSAHARASRRSRGLFRGSGRHQRGDPGSPREARARQVAAGAVHPLCDGSLERRPRTVAHHRPAGRHRNPQPAARLGRTHTARADRVGRDRDSARHLRGGETELLGRSHLPRGDDGRRLAAGVLHRTHPRLCLLLSARVVARAARTARYLPVGAAEGHRLLSCRQPDRGRPGNIPCLRSASFCCRRSPSLSSRSRRSRA